MKADVTPAVEFSSGIAIGDNNAAGFQLHAVSAAGTFTSVVAQLQGSNDLCNWQNITSATLTATTAPSLQFYNGAAAAVIPWAYVRLRYTATAASGVQVMIKAAIELFQKG